MAFLAKTSSRPRAASSSTAAAPSGSKAVRTAFTLPVSHPRAVTASACWASAPSSKVSRQLHVNSFQRKTGWFPNHTFTRLALQAELALCGILPSLRGLPSLLQLGVSLLIGRQVTLQGTDLLLQP